MDPMERIASALELLCLNQLIEGCQGQPNKNEMMSIRSAYAESLTDQQVASCVTCEGTGLTPESCCPDCTGDGFVVSAQDGEDEDERPADAITKGTASTIASEAAQVTSSVERAAIALTEVNLDQCGELARLRGAQLFVRAIRRAERDHLLSFLCGSISEAQVGEILRGAHRPT